jgi:hypothetical protein
MPLSDIVTVAISTTAPAPTQQGFGVPLILGACQNATFGADRIRYYGSLTAMVSDGFLTTDPEYIAAQAMFSQNPAPPQLAVGRRANKPTQQFKIKILQGVIGKVYTAFINGVAKSFTAVDGDGRREHRDRSRGRHRYAHRLRRRRRSDGHRHHHGERGGQLVPRLGDEPERRHGQLAEPRRQRGAGRPHRHQQRRLHLVRHHLDLRRHHRRDEHLRGGPDRRVGRGEPEALHRRTCRTRRSSAAGTSTSRATSRR